MSKYFAEKLSFLPYTNRNKSLIFSPGWEDSNFAVPMLRILYKRFFQPFQSEITRAIDCTSYNRVESIIV